MKGKYSKLINEYCSKEGIYVPPGFKRHTASHFAVFRFDGEKPKLVAKTFFTKEDLEYYIKTNLCGLEKDCKGNLPARVIDFKGNIEFSVAENGQLNQL